MQALHTMGVVMNILRRMILKAKDMLIVPSLMYRGCLISKYMGLMIQWVCPSYEVTLVTCGMFELVSMLHIDFYFGLNVNAQPKNPTSQYCCHACVMLL